MQLSAAIAAGLGVVLAGLVLVLLRNARPPAPDEAETREEATADVSST
jgi:hypothetical protein